MQDTIQTIQQKLDALLNEGFALFTGAVQGRQSDQALTFMTTQATYQSWYAKALRVIRQLYPELADDFQAHYRALLAMHRMTTYPSWYRKALRLMHTWTGQRAHDATDPAWEGPYGKQAASDTSVSHASMGMAMPRNSETMWRVRMTFLTRLSQQVSMLNAVRNGLEYVLADLQSTLYGEVGDHIQATAYELFRRGQPRAAGALAGVLLELHLAKVATKYRVSIRHTSPGLTTLNAALKRGGIYDGEVWRFIQRLGALGQACVYASTHEPTVDELTEFLQGVQRIRTRVR
jgi:hypothetical protein